MSETNNKQNSNSLTPAPPKTTTVKKVKPKQTKQNAEAARFKAKYFEYYDDVKTHNNGPYDW